MKNALRLMKRDHDVIADLFSDLQRLLNEDDSEEEIRKGFFVLKQALVTHLNAEEEAVYSFLKKREETRVTAFESAAEHGVMMDLLEKMSDSHKIDDEWKAEFEVLRIIVEHHVANEELELFPYIAKIFTESELKAMGEDMEQLEELIEETVFTPKPLSIEGLRSPRPRSPESRRGY